MGDHGITVVTNYGTQTLVAVFSPSVVRSDPRTKVVATGAGW